ncbi:NADPH-dependent aldehyde reductase Ahr [Tahibacter amnicola]|uniref:NAD(P)-dependent alcohol dehydrogenase n=1 Tax=Tahibacter amnicola TaxID=2976241 RepID=A0ABY6BGR4_9GAMM|nr:NAD(P)-dependent alcohol dehydrogenase [Tahibacter amnicola]UXI67796.1 NAD(P)-dependent alcohol dehydrogenase [Tahibacter amnicola]
MSTIRAWAAPAAGAPLEPFTYTTGPLGADEVEIAVDYCGLCHSDLSMRDNEWGRTTYPFVPGHEIVGRIVACGAAVKGREVGQRVGLGWFSGSCQYCHSCLRGDQHLCGSSQETIVGRHGGFAERVRSHWLWVTPLPESLASEACGPLFCGGITVFNPILLAGVKPTDRVGVVGIGGLGHLAIQFLRRWGCEVTAFTSSEAKRDEAMALGAHQVVPSNDKSAIKRWAGYFDFILVTVNVALEWPAFTAALAPRGRLHFVGAVLEPIQLPAFSLIGGQKSVGGSPVGSPATVETMLGFCARHAIAPQIEVFPMSRVNDALAHLAAGKARYRVVLKADFD